MAHGGAHPEAHLYTHRDLSIRIACMRRRVVVSALLLSCSAALLAGCGQKGPLFLPARGAIPATAASSPPAPAVSTARPAPASTAAAAAGSSGGL
ncbi:MAG TPA: lipoprotein [Rhodanobacteraceae bacterium]|nr:lipoprotein [Rhodanobacteraceae bacterium]